LTMTLCVWEAWSFKTGSRIVAILTVQRLHGLGPGRRQRCRSNAASVARGARKLIVYLTNLSITRLKTASGIRNVR
jgi:hypothetical protein